MWITPTTVCKCVAGLVKAVVKMSSCTGGTCLSEECMIHVHFMTYKTFETLSTRSDEEERTAEEISQRACYNWRLMWL